MSDHLIGRRRFWSIVPSLGLIWGGAALASFLVNALSRAPLPSLIDALLYRPMMLFASLLASVLYVERVFKQRAETLWQELITLLPVAFLGAICLSFFGIWNDGSGTAALAGWDALWFIVSGGLIPLTLGPDVLLRMTLLALVVLVGWKSVHTGQLSRRQAVKRSVCIWIAGSGVLLLQTWLVHFMGIIRHATVQTSLDASRILGMIHTDSYWSNFQADRFFTGVGKQLEMGIVLSTTSLAFLVGCGLVYVIARTRVPWSREGVVFAIVKRVATRSFFFLMSAMLSAVFVGLGLYRYRTAWTLLDVISFFLLFNVFLATYAYWALSQEIEDLAYDEVAHPDYPLPSSLVRVDDLEDAQTVLGAIALFGGMLLGWPVMIVLIGMWIIWWLRSRQGFGWRGERWWNIGTWMVLGLSAAVTGGAFSARSALLVPSLLELALGWAWLAGLLQSLPFMIFQVQGYRRFIPYGYMLAASIVFGVIVNAPVVIAIMAFILLGLYWKSHSQDQTTQLRYASWGVIVFGWASVLLMRIGR